MRGLSHGAPSRSTRVFARTALAVILPQACRFWYRTASAIYDDGKR
jgi:hypothetical protein